MAKTQQKNRRCRHAKFSEYRLRKLVMCFAQDMTVRDTAAKTGFSEPTVRHHFMGLRQRIYDHGFLRISKRSSGPMPARIIFARKHRGVPERYAHLYEAEFLHGAFATKNTKVFKRFSAAKKGDMEALKKFINYNRINRKYDIIEVLAGEKKPGRSAETREFDPMDYESTSSIVVNEINIDPHEAFFRFIWQLLLKNPL